MSKRDRTNGVPTTATSIPLVDPHAIPPNPSIGDLVKDATAQMSTLVRAEVELAKAEITRDVKKGLTGSIFFILALVVLLYSTFFMFFFLAELLDTWLWRWAAFLIVFILMLVVTAVFALLGYLKVRRIRGPQQTIESVKETTAALTPGLSKFAGGSSHTAPAAPAALEPVPARTEPSVSRRPPLATPAVVSSTPAVTAPVIESFAPEYAQEQTDLGSVDYLASREGVDYEDTTAHIEYIQHDEPTTTVVYTQHDEPTTTVVYTPHEPDTYIQYRQYPTDDDPAAAVYSDTGLPITPPGDPSGW